jgi:Fur family transcriptional regulator, ferric uptake regulator
MKKHQHQPKDFAGRLRESARKITGPRRAILTALEREEHPLTIREIQEQVGPETCDLATIYRSMHMLERVGLVKRFDFGDGAARFELIRHDHDEHHHHLVCTGCSKVVEIEECFPAELEQRIASGNGFASISHRLEFFGICPSCQTNRG